ncbi:MAG: DUF3040 domain-containing protein [Trebonia sp.]
MASRARVPRWAGAPGRYRRYPTSLEPGERQALAEIESGLRRSDPELAAMLGLLTVRYARLRSALMFMRLHGKLVKSFVIGAVISLSIGIAIAGVLTMSPVRPVGRGPRATGSPTPSQRRPDDHARADPPVTGSSA